MGAMKKNRLEKAWADAFRANFYDPLKAKLETYPETERATALMNAYHRPYMRSADQDMATCIKWMRACNPSALVRAVNDHYDGLVRKFNDDHGEAQWLIYSMLNRYLRELEGMPESQQGDATRAALDALDEAQGKRRMDETPHLMARLMFVLQKVFDGRSIDSFDGVFNGKKVEDWGYDEHVMYYALVMAPKDFGDIELKDGKQFFHVRGLSREINRVHVGPFIRPDETWSMSTEFDPVLVAEELQEVSGRDDYPMPPLFHEYLRSWGTVFNAHVARGEEEVASKTDEELFSDEVINADEGRMKAILAEFLCAETDWGWDKADGYHARLLRFAINKFPALRTECHEKAATDIEASGMTPEEREMCIAEEHTLWVEYAEVETLATA